jgi:uncharacterized protein (TIGR03435 family)
MRLMMQSLLADRFRLAIHKQSRDVPAFALVPLNPGKTGTQLRPHKDAAPCPTENGTAAPAQPLDNGLPALCGGIFGMSPREPGRARAAARNVTVALIAEFLAGPGRLDRPVVNQTGMEGTFDFSLEWTPEPVGLATPRADSPAGQPELSIVDAIREQLGLKLESVKGRVEIFVVDRVERPSEN